MIISYDGTFFHGFQRQKDANSIQEDIETVLSKIFKSPITIEASGRTDAFVHAKGQVAHFDSEQEIPVENLRKVLNKNLYPHIYIKSVENVPDTFYARKSVVKKEYRYFVSINEFDPHQASYVHFFHDRIDIGKIREAMKYIVGTHDFRSFAKADEEKNCVRTVYEFNLNVHDGILEFSIVGDGFLRNMVRIIIALMLKIGEGRFEPSYVQTALDAKSRLKVPFVASPHGLYLWQVFYE